MVQQKCVALPEYSSSFSPLRSIIRALKKKRARYSKEGTHKISKRRKTDNYITNIKKKIPGRNRKLE